MFLDQNQLIRTYCKYFPRLNNKRYRVFPKIRFTLKIRPSVSFHDDFNVRSTLK